MPWDWLNWWAFRNGLTSNLHFKLKLSKVPRACCHNGTKGSLCNASTLCRPLHQGSTYTLLSILVLGPASPAIWVRSLGYRILYLYMFTFDRCVQHLYKAHSAWCMSIWAWKSTPLFVLAEAGSIITPQKTLASVLISARAARFICLCTWMTWCRFGRDSAHQKEACCSLKTTELRDHFMKQSIFWARRWDRSRAAKTLNWTISALLQSSLATTARLTARPRTFWRAKVPSNC